MLKILLALGFLTCSVHSISQQKTPGKSLIDLTIREIENFEEKEQKKDSAAGRFLGSAREEDYHRNYLFHKKMRSRLEKINKKSLAFDDLVNLELLQHHLSNEISLFEHKSYLNPILSDNGFHSNTAFLANGVFNSKKEFAEYISKLRDIPRFLREGMDNMRKGIELGISQPAIILKGYESTYNGFIVENPETSIFWRPFLNKPANLSEQDWEKLKEEGRAAIRENVIKGYKDFKEFFENEYLVNTRKTIGVSHFPRGLEYYQNRVAHFTTTQLTYEEIYELGKSEVTRIRGEMLEILNELKFKGSLQDFIVSLRDDPKSYPTSADQLLKEASFIAKKADGKLPLLFKKLPRQPYGVEPVPEHLAPNYTTGRYSGAPIDGKRAAHYWVNTFNLPARTLYTLEALTLHEAVPGHHLQIAMAKEMEDISKFRKNYYVNAYGEGWALYAEHLGTEMGFYKDPYSRFGKLTYEMWRACRLVLDVALHTKEWTREQAVNYLAENTALSIHEVNTEINRYISWPGQALSYKIGELKIKELRKKAEEKLKEKFDVREFHEAVLSEGAVTMTLLEKIIDNYIAKTLRKTK